MAVNQMRAHDMSPMQVSTVTTQPLLGAPLQQFGYPVSLNPPAYQQMHTMRMYEPSQQIQYLPGPNASNTPTPTQPPPYTSGQGPQLPPQQYQVPPPQNHPPYPMICPIIQTQPHMLQTGMHYMQQPPPQPGHPIQVILSHQPQQHGPAP